MEVDSVTQIGARSEKQFGELNLGSGQMPQTCTQNSLKVPSSPVSVSCLLVKQLPELQHRIKCYGVHKHGSDS